MSDVTIVLQAIGRGEKQATADLLPLVYDELRRMAAARMAGEAVGHTLQATALVHEAWLRLAGEDAKIWDNRAHFFGAASEAMRRILIGKARKKASLKRGGNQQRINIEDLELAESTADDKLLLIDEALAALEAENPDRARVVVAKFFGGLTNKEIAETLGISERSVNRHWLCARAWLFLKLQEEE
jgi:RNA polymerase sigma factor (TIGR02999 family)